MKDIQNINDFLFWHRTRSEKRRISAHDGRALIGRRPGMSQITLCKDWTVNEIASWRRYSDDIPDVVNETYAV